MYTEKTVINNNVNKSNRHRGCLMFSCSLNDELMNKIMLGRLQEKREEGGAAWLIINI